MILTGKIFCLKYTFANGPKPKYLVNAICAQLKAIKRETKLFWYVNPGRCHC